LVGRAATKAYAFAYAQAPLNNLHR
jgi:hypothetical protein